ncbi:40S ribosomal protein S2 [Aduncisulcus paluster]|uniref:Small ribosomal subunit protein uS5 n=1 Tax=Aduncisulcus paluster TaxID=2918883 RepID=A0ABQ5K0H6_9EUKA|nr:40S ribosomal protein S2 [Aduncisulcus paluster]
MRLVSFRNVRVMPEEKQQQQKQQSGFGRGGRGGKRPQRRAKPQAAEWVPATKLGRLVKAGKIRSLTEIFLNSMPIKEYQIIDHFFKEGATELVDEVIKIQSVQKQTNAGQRTRFKAYVLVGDRNGHVGLGIKVAKEVAGAIRGAIVNGKLGLIPIRRGYWGNNIGAPHTIPFKLTGKAGSVRVRLIPAPRGTGIVAAPVSKKVLQFAGVQDCFTSSTGSTRTLGSFVVATMNALRKSFTLLTPDLWAKTRVEPAPFDKHSAFLAKKDVKVAAE